MKTKFIFLLSILFLFVCFILPNSIFAQSQPVMSRDFKSSIVIPKISKIIRVGIIETAPFAEIDANGKASGLSVAIWEEIAKENNWHYQYIKLARDYKMAIQDLNAHKVDVLLGPTPVTYISRQYVDFSRPYFLDTIDILAMPTHSAFWANIWFFISHIFNYMFFSVLFLFFVLANIIWLSEHGKRTVYDDKYLKGVGHALWLLVHSVTAMDVSFPEYVKSKIAGVLVTLWMVVSLLFVASIIAGLSSALTLSQGSNFAIKSLHDIAGKTLAVFPEGHEYLVAKKLGAKPVIMQNYDDGIKLLEAGKVVGILDHRTLLNDYLVKHPNLKAEVIDLSIEEDEYAFGFNRQSPLLLPFDIALTKLQDKSYVSTICKQFVSQEDAQSCDL